MQRCGHAGSVLGTSGCARSRLPARVRWSDRLPRRFATDVTANHAVARRSESSAEVLCPRSGDVGNRMIGQRQARVGRPARGIEWRTSLRGAQDSQVLEDAPDDSCILDQRNNAHRPFALRALQRIGLVHLGSWGRSTASYRRKRAGNLARRHRNRCVRSRDGDRRTARSARSCALPPRGERGPLRQAPCRGAVRSATEGLRPGCAGGRPRREAPPPRALRCARRMVTCSKQRDARRGGLIMLVERKQLGALALSRQPHTSGGR